MNLKDLFDQTVAAYGPTPYLIFYDQAGEGHSWTYDRFAAQVYGLAAQLRSQGLADGGRVAIVSPNRPEVLIGYFACWVVGACACPINIEEPPARKRFILNNAGCQLALVEAGFMAELGQLQPETPSLTDLIPLETISHFDQAAGDWAAPAPDAPAFLVYTSGTTGDPKGVELRHYNLVANAQATATWHQLQAGDGVMTVLPIHHVNGAAVTGLTPFLAGGRNILNHRFSPGSFWSRLAAERAVLASVVPTLLEFLLSADEDIAPYDLSALRYLICGAGPLLRETVLRFEDRFQVSICHGFGMSETTAYNTQMPMDLPPAARRTWYSDYDYPSIGCAIACNQVAILRPDGSRAKPLERGEIAISGPTVMAGYLNNPAANAKSFHGDWFLSGDEGFYALDEGGRPFFFISGRLKELIIRGGVNISPLDIDEVLKQMAGVAFALTLPFENVYYGEEIAAYIVPEAEAQLEEAAVLAFARQRLPFSHTPKVVLFGQTIPFTTTGKPKRIQLAQDLAEQLAPYRQVQFRP